MKYSGDIQEPTDVGQAQRPAVLVVDDESDIRMLLEDILCPHYRVFTAKDGLEALEVLHSRPAEIDLV
jgi:CheY-like chemotaxis protein